MHIPPILNDIFFAAIFLAIIFTYIFIDSLRWKLKCFKTDTERSLKNLEESTKRDFKRLQEENYDLRDQLRKIKCKN